MEIGQEIRLSRAVGNEDASKPENRTLSDPFDDDEKEEEVKPVVKPEPVQQPKQQVHQPRPQQQSQNPRPQQQQNPKPQQQQPKPRNNVEDPNGLYDFRGGCVIGARTNDNRVALDPSGSIFTFTSRDLSAYFERYFKHHGYENIYFGDGSAQLNDIPQMYLIFPKMEKIAVAGRSASDIEVELLGGKSRGAHVKLDGRFKELVRPFVDMSKLVVNESHKRDKNGRAFCYIELDADAVLSALFLHNKAYRVILLDTVQQGSNVLYRVARLREVNNNGSDIREIIEHITK
jgi:hypothetical protein